MTATTVDQLAATARAQCLTCGAPIVWAHTANNRRMPVNATPGAGGNVVLFVGYDADRQPFLSCNVLRQTQLSGARAAGQRLHTSHFKSCPEAARHRRR